MKTAISFRKFLVLLISALLVSGGFFSTHAIELSEAKAQLVVGETPSGYLAIVSPPGTNEVQALVSSINNKRKTKYKSIAKKNRQKLLNVEMLAGKTALGKTKPGLMVQDRKGNWKKK